MTPYANRAYWIDAYGDYTPNPPLRSDAQVDVAVIGGGYVGLSTAWHLRRMDAATSVAVLESEVIGYGASGRNGGWIIPQFGIDPLMVRAIYGREKAQRAIDYCDESYAYIRQIIQEQNFDCDYRESGILKLAIGQNGVKLIEKFKEQSEETGHGEHLKWLDGAAIRQELECEMVDAALYESNVATMQPCKLNREWKRIAGEAGATVYEDTPAVSMDRSGDKIVIKTPRGTLTADRLVLATNGFSHQLGGEIGRQVRRDQMPMTPVLHVTEPLSEERWQRVVSRTWQCPMETSFGLYHGYTPTPDRRLVFWYFQNVQTSAADYMRPYEYDVDNRELAIKHLSAILPGLEGVKVAQTWGGPMSVTVDMVPHLGFLGRDTRVALSTGCSGHGVSTAMLHGKTLAELLLGKDTERTNQWFVTRPKWRWPGAGLATLGVKGFVGYMRLEHRMALKKTPLPRLHEA